MPSDRQESAAAASLPQGPHAAALTALRGPFPVLAPGEVWLVGAGPGDPGLLTLDAVAGLVQADVIVHDALVDARVLSLARPGTRLQFAGKRGGKPSIAQNEISAQLIEFARSGLRVVRLKGGDPLVFGRGGEELLALAEAGIPFRVVSGVTSGLGGLGSAWIPSTLRGINRAIILATGHNADNDVGMDWAAIARTRQPIVLYMGRKNIGSIAASLMQGGLPATTPSAVIASATLEHECVLITNLECVAEDIRKAGLQAPLIIAIGEIVRTRQLLQNAIAQAKAAITSEE